MKLLGSTGSPYARKVRVVLIDKQIPHQWTEVATPRLIASSGRHEWKWEPNALWNIDRINPLGKIPVLLDGTRALYDSRIICEHLEMLAPSPSLLGQGLARVQILQVEAYADGVCDAIGAALALARRAPEAERGGSRDTWAASRAQVDGFLQLMDQAFADRAGERYTLAEISACVALEYIDFRMGGMDWRRRYPRLERLQQQSAARSSFQRTALPPPVG